MLVAGLWLVLLAEGIVAWAAVVEFGRVVGIVVVVAGIRAAGIQAAVAVAGIRAAGIQIRAAVAEAGQTVRDAVAVAGVVRAAVEVVALVGGGPVVAVAGTDSWCLGSVSH